jgi:hypothetical protein
MIWSILGGEFVVGVKSAAISLSIRVIFSAKKGRKNQQITEVSEVFQRKI